MSDVLGTTNTKEKMREPLLEEDESRFVFFPIQHNDIYEMYLKSVECFWRAEEVDLSKDLNDWDKLTKDEKHFIKMILCFFASSDGVVLENLGVRFMTEVQNAEARAFYGFQIAMENIHSQTYSLLIDTYIRNKEEKQKCFESLKEYPCIRKKADWAMKYIKNKEDSFATRLVAFSIVEGIFFSGAFCSIFWIKKRGLLQGLTFSNELISRDEALHTEFAILIYSKLKNKLTSREIHTIIKEAVEVEKEFILEALPVRLIGMNSKMMSDYIEFVADRLAIQLGTPKIYETSNPFDFMDMISVESKANFFERRVSEYALANKKMEGELTFSLDETF